VLLLGSPTTRAQRGLMAWFGIRGIGSLYYLTYALNHDAGAPAAAAVAGLTISTVALSIVLHGITVQPALNWYRRRLAAAQEPAAPRDTGHTVHGAPNSAV
jgi:NhaP-type Na+/H+ or K+/H+ antiporter